MGKSRIALGALIVTLTVSCVGTEGKNQGFSELPHDTQSLSNLGPAVKIVGLTCPLWELNIDQEAIEASQAFFECGRYSQIRDATAIICATNEELADCLARHCCFGSATAEKHLS